MTLQHLRRAILGCIALVFAAQAYDIGVGIADMTGPAVEVTFMGYGVSTQKGKGIHMRQWARAFVIKDEDKHVAFVSMDVGMGSDIVNKLVLDELDSKLGKGVYTYDNLCISGTHTHSAPGGFLQYVMVEVPTAGFVKETLMSMVTGVSAAVIKAHQSTQAGTVRYANGKLYDSNINRSPTSYLLNPQAERDSYPDGDTDKDMLLLRFDAADGTPLGMLNWFAVHGTSLNNTNRHISGDNKGYASYLYEKHMNGKESLPGSGTFVAAFAATNLGDVSPNTAGPHCTDSGLACDSQHSTCHGKEELCVASGPGKDMWESMEIIGRKQFDKAVEIYKDAETGPLIAGPLDYRHSFVEFGNVSVKLENGTEVKTCPAALGYGFAAGTTDGCGMFDFTQGVNHTNPFWNVVSGFLSKPTKEQVECQHPKPILLNLNKIHFPYAWEAPSQPIQIFRLGQLIISAPPGELTTMAGRRFRKFLKEKFAPSMKGVEPVVTIAGLSNNYMHYMTTFEEYQAQRYEAASTIYGPHQLSAFMQEYGRLSDDMLNGRASATVAPPPDTTKKQDSFLPPVVFDYAPWGKKFGEQVVKPQTQYKAGEVASAKFQSANPRNNRRLQSSFMTVDRQEGGNTWKTVLTDADWETMFTWSDTAHALGAESFAVLDWNIPADVMSGTYRICHQGDSKGISTGFKVTPFSGCSDSFQVASSDVDILV